MGRIRLIDDLEHQAETMNRVLDDLRRSGRTPADLPELLKETKKQYPYFFTRLDLLEYNGNAVTVKDPDVIRGQFRTPEGRTGRPRVEPIPDFLKRIKFR